MDRFLRWAGTSEQYLTAAAAVLQDRGWQDPPINGRHEVDESVRQAVGSEFLMPMAAWTALRMHLGRHSVSFQRDLLPQLIAILRSSAVAARELSYLDEIPEDEDD